ncbi:DUF6474 family protein [Corynebacterium aquilae]|uniref:DUF6474 family protein n=1 Tax=Corynebacterium aquilae TaxID=203263 RepID=UPI003182F45D
MLKKILKKRRAAKQAAKTEVKAAQARARAQVKARAQLTKSQAKLLERQEKKLRKAESKGLKAKRKHERKLAETKLKQLEAGRLNKATVSRFLGVARLAAPVVLPLLYQAITKARSVGVSAQAQRLGVSAQALGEHSGHGAPLKARIDGVKNTLKESSLPAGFVRDANNRLDKLVEAVDNAEFLTPDQRRRAYRSINGDIDGVVGEIQDRHHKA